MFENIDNAYTVFNITQGIYASKHHIVPYKYVTTNIHNYHVSMKSRFLKAQIKLPTSLI